MQLPQKQKQQKPEVVEQLIYLCHMPRCRVIQRYQTEYTDPIVVSKGEVLTLGGRDTQWVGWIWCWNGAGKGGWVAERYLELAEATGTMLRDYDAHELNVNTGEELEILDEESGWLWCRNSAQHEGWIPAENVQRL